MKKALLLSASLLLAGSTAFADCPAGQNEVTVSITTDRYGDETTWTLTGPAGTPVYASGGPYTTQSSNGAYPQTPVTVCIPDGSLVIFTIYDAYGDGLCCNYGQGTYSVTMNGNVVVPYASFQLSRQSIFLAASQAPDQDVAMQAITLAEMIGAGSTPIKGTVRNFGSSAISSFQVSYSIDGSAAVTSTITANVNSNAQYNFTHPTSWDATSGVHTVKVWVTLADGSADAYAVNDTAVTTVSVATQSVQRTALMEEFTSSTCGPCYSLNVSQGFDQLLSNLNTNQPGSHLAAIKYQMNWPAPGNDPSYNGDGNTRRGYYGVNGVPDVYLDGKDMSNPTSQAAFNAAVAKPSFASMDVSYVQNVTTVDVTVNVTPHFSGSGYKTYIAITEDYYHYPGAYTPQKDYHFAMRKMLPNGSGINMASLVADEEQSFTRSYTLVEGGPAQGNYNLWGTVNGITVVAFVQNVSTKEIIQAAFATQPVNVGIHGPEAESPLQIWPNPTNGLVQMRYNNATGTNADVEVFNTLGERVLGTKRTFAGNGQVETIDLSGMEPGMYLVRLIAEGKVTTQRINLVK